MNFNNIIQVFNTTYLPMNENLFFFMTLTIVWSYNLPRCLFGEKKLQV